MKEYILEFSDSTYNKRKFWSETEFNKFKSYIGKTDKNGVTLLSITEIKKVSPIDLLISLK